MATVTDAKSRSLHSWWWDSHISPKDSKWLQENLTDMDKNVKAMIKLLEEDADSFRKRAETCYRKHPELMKLVEEFYRAYRALAERYDHATGALRQAQRTMAEAFPDQIPQMFTDESPSGSSGIDSEPQTSNMLHLNDALDGSSHSHAMKGTGFFSEENDGNTSKEGLRQLNGMFATGGEAPPQNGVTQLSEKNEKLKNQITSGAERGEKAEVDGLKGTVYKLESDKETAFLQCQLSQEKIFSLEAELSCTQDDLKKLNEEMLVNITNLKGVEEQCHLLEEGSQSLKLELNLFKETSKTKKEELYMTQEENKRLKNQMTSESERADKAQTEVQNLKGTISKLESDKEAAFFQCQLSEERIAILEAELTRTQEYSKKLNEEMSSNIANLKSFEEHCHLLDEENQSLQLDLNFLKDTAKEKQEELDMKQEDNQRLKNQITSVSELADKAQSEVDSLKGTISKLDSDKEVAFLQYQLSQERISSLEAELSHTQEHLKKLNDEMLSNIANLKSVEEQCHLLEEGNQSLQVELNLCKEMAKTNQDELGMRQDELEKLKISIEDEKERSVQIKMACMSLEELHSRSQEEVRLLTLEVHSGAETLELTKASLEEEVKHLKEENGDLKEEKFSNSLKMSLQDEISLLNESKRRLEGEVELYVEENGSLKEEDFSCSMKIMNLQDEISLLNESKKRLEDEVKLHTEEKKVLQQEIISMKEARRDLELRHHEMTQQIGALSLNVESLQALVKELRDGNVELKELCKMYEEEKVVHLDSLKHLGKIREKNVVLESSLSNTSVELEELREKVKALEESCKALQDKVLMHISDKAILLSQIEAIAQNMEKMSEKNAVSKNSLSDANIELEGLRVKLKSLEESCQSQHNKESNLLMENNTLVTQLKSTSQSLENSESRYAELECKSMNLEKERGHLLCQIIELQGSLKMEKEQHETLLQFSKVQLATLENQIRQAISTRTGSSLPPQVLPGIGLHLNTVATISKDRMVTPETPSFGRRVISMPCTISPFPPLIASKSLDIEKEKRPACIEVPDPEGVHDDSCETPTVGGGEDLNHSSPRKKRKSDNGGETEACKRCNCNKSKCLKLYCECFAAGVYCVEPCSCQGCFNKPVHEETVLATRKQIESRNPLAFSPKVIRASEPVQDAKEENNKTPASARHKRGCNCKKSSCLKKYCECYQGGVGCSPSCRCDGCKNAFGRKDAAEEIEPGDEEIDEKEKQMEIPDEDMQNAVSQNSEQPLAENISPITPCFQIRSSSVKPPFHSSGKPPQSSTLSMGHQTSQIFRRCDIPLYPCKTETLEDVTSLSLDFKR